MWAARTLMPIFLVAEVNERPLATTARAELATHNRLVGGSSPPSSTTQSPSNRDFLVLDEKPRIGGDSCAHFVSAGCRLDFRAAKNTCLAIYSRAVNAEASLADVLATNFSWCAEWEGELKRLFGNYVEAKQRQNVLDYDDLLLYWAQMMQEGEIARDVASRFDHVFVDEYQDTNRLQASILLALKPDGKGLTVVGDDAQSIYSFRAATVRNILDFPKQFTPPARIVTLDRNYRSTQPILAAANAVIDLAVERHKKNLRSERPSAERPQLVLVRDEADQARYVVDRVLEHRESGILLKRQAVLFRASHHRVVRGGAIGWRY